MSQDEQDVKDVKPKLEPKLSIVINYEGQVCTIRARPGMPFKKIFEAAETRFGKQPGTFKFFFQGKRVLAQSTPAELDMDDDDIIDAHLEQLGGSW